MSETLLKVSNLSVEFRSSRGITNAVNDVSWSVARGETLAALDLSGLQERLALLLTG